MYSLGFLLKDFDVSQLTYYLSKNIADVLDKRSDLDIIVFQQSLIRPPMRAPFAILHERELWSYTGTCITTKPELAKNLLSVPQCKQKVFYVVDIEWNRQQMSHEDMATIYNDLDLIAENEHIANILGKTWKEPLGIANNFDIEKILEILQI